MMDISACITAVAGYVPPDKLTNADLEALVNTTHEWIVERTGIHERRILKGEKGTSTMAVEAVKCLCEKRGITPQEIDAVICATITPDMLFPCTANLVCDALQISSLSFDLLAACTGFLYGLEIASNFIKSGNYKKVVVIGADKMTSITDYEDRTSCILFGDGAGAVLLEPNYEGIGILDTLLETDGNGKEILYKKAGGSAFPITPQRLEQKEHLFHQEGRQVYKHAVSRVSSTANTLLTRNQLKGEEIDFVVPHQANERILASIGKRINIPYERFTINIDHFGNTAGATIPLCLWEWEKQFKPHHKLLLTAFGAGLTWGAMYLT
ncbi:MAG: beta-ketoacyl-ACP synthase III, partial [Bacteroidota bacterium]